MCKLLIQWQKYKNMRDIRENIEKYFFLQNILF